MTAAELTPSVVQKTYKHATSLSGTPIITVEYLVKVTKAAQSDWIVVATHCPGTFLFANGNTIDGSSDGAIETVTYVNSTDKLVMGGSDVGTAYLRVVCSE